MRVQKTPLDLSAALGRILDELEVRHLERMCAEDLDILETDIREAQGFGALALSELRRGEVTLATHAFQVAARYGREALGLLDGTVSFR